MIGDREFRYQHFPRRYCGLIVSTTVGGEDINITLTFLRSIRNVGDSRFSLTHVSTDTLSTLEPHNLLGLLVFFKGIDIAHVQSGNQRIDPHSPLVLSSSSFESTPTSSFLS